MLSMGAAHTIAISAPVFNNQLRHPRRYIRDADLVAVICVVVPHSLIPRAKCRVEAVAQCSILAQHARKCTTSIEELELKFRAQNIEIFALRTAALGE